MTSNAQRLKELFKGSETRHGFYGEPQKETKPTGVKWGIGSTARTGFGPATLEHFEKHLEGSYPLGIIPITSNDGCWWGSIDIDDYSLNPLDVIRRIESLNLPLVPVVSKSGGLHLFIFLAEEQPAALVQSVLAHLAAKLGLGNSEIFPKQTTVLASSGDAGNWLCIPFLGTTYNGKLSEQTGIKKTGARSTIEEFLNLAENHRVYPAQLNSLDGGNQPPPANRSFGSPKKDPAAPFSDGPPCLAHLADQGVHDGQGRNSTLFMMALYYIRKDETTWKKALEDANRTFFKPPLDSEEVQTVIKSVEKKGARDPNEGYRYTCKTQPMVNHCNSKLCRGRRHGIGSNEEFPRLTGVSKLNTEPPVWFVNVNNIRIEASTEQLQNYYKFHQLCMEKGNVCFPAIKQSDWLASVGNAMNHEVTLIEVSPEVGVNGHFKELLDEFLTDRQMADDKDELFRGLPWRDPETGNIYFKLTNLTAYLDKQGFRAFNRARVVQRVKELGGDKTAFHLKTGYINVWFVPANQLPTPPTLATPPLPKTPI